MSYSASFGGLPCVDPYTEYQEQSKLEYDTSWSDKANSFANPLGSIPGKGWILMLRRDLNQLDINTRYDLTFSNLDPASPLEKITLKKLLIVKATCLTPGKEGDENSCYLVELIDSRWAARNKPIDFQINVLSPNTSAKYYESSLNRSSEESIPWTWSLAIKKIWDTNGTLGEFPGLPYEPEGIPSGYHFLAASSYDALSVMLAKIHCSLRYDPQTHIYDIVKLGETADLDSVLSEKRSHLIYDAEVLESDKARITSKVRVYFHKAHNDYGQENTTESSTKQWVTDSYIYKDYSVADFDDVGIETLTLEENSTQIFWDDSSAIVNSDGTIDNDAELATRAQEIAHNYYLASGAGGTRLLKKYSGIHPEFKPSGELKYVCWKFTKAGVTTEIARTIGFIDGMSLISPYTHLEQTENLMPPDFSRESYPIYFPQIQLVEVLEGPVEENYYRAQVIFFNPTTSSLDIRDECWLVCPDTMTLQSGEIGLAKVFGKKEINSETKPVYYISSATNTVSSQSSNILLNIKDYVPILSFSNYDYYEANIITFTKDPDTSEVTYVEGESCYAAVTHQRKPELNFLHPGVKIAIINEKALYKIVLEHVRFVKPGSNEPLKGSVYSGVAYGLDYGNEGPISIANNNIENCYINDLRFISTGITPQPGSPAYIQNPSETQSSFNPNQEVLDSNEVASPSPVWYTTYFHLGEIYVEKGQELIPGQLIGTIGEYESSEPHLHFSLADGQNIDIAEAGNTLDVSSWMRMPIVGQRVDSQPGDVIPTANFTAAQRRVIQSYFAPPVDLTKGHWRIVQGSQFHRNKQYYDMDVSLEENFTAGQSVYSAIASDSPNLLTRVVGTGNVAGQTDQAGTPKNLKFVFLQHEIKPAPPAQPSPLATIDYLDYPVVEGEGFVYKGSVRKLDINYFYIGRYQGILDLDGTLLPSYAIDPDYITVGTRSNDVVGITKKLIFEDNNFDVEDVGNGNAYVKGVLFQNHGVSLYRRKKINFKTEVAPEDATVPFLAKDNPDTQSTDVIFYVAAGDDGDGGGGGGLFISSVLGIAPIYVDNSVKGLARVGLDIPLKVIYGGTQRNALNRGSTLVGDNTNPVALIQGNPYTLYNHKYNYNYPFPEWTIWSKIQGVSQTGIHTAYGSKVRKLEAIQTSDSGSTTFLCLYLDNYDNRLIVISDDESAELENRILLAKVNNPSARGTIGLKRVNKHSNTLSEYEIVVPLTSDQRGTYPYVYDLYLKNEKLGIQHISQNNLPITNQLLPLMFPEDTLNQEHLGYLNTIPYKILLENIVGLGRGGQVTSILPGTIYPEVVGNIIDDLIFTTEDILIGYTYKGRMGYFSDIDYTSLTTLLNRFETII